MRLFDALSFEEKLRHFEDVARRALPLWNLPPDAKLKLLNFTENATFLVTEPDGNRRIMRVHRLDYATEHSIQTELSWIQTLHEETPIALPSPIPMKDGGYVATVDTPALDEKRHVVCFTFECGKPPVDSSDGNSDVGDLIAKIEKIPDRITVPAFKAAASLYDFAGRFHTKSGMTQTDREVYRSIGEIMAHIHRQAKTWHRPPFFERIEWDFEGTFGERNNFYNTTYADPKWLSHSEINAITRARNVIAARLAAYGKSPNRYGMIHSDLRTANLLKDGNRLTVLDFDDCGMGWYMYDVASVLSFMEHRPDIDEVINEILTGYQRILPVSDEDKAEIPTFVLMRRIGLLQSLLSRIGCVMGGSGEAAELTPEILAFYVRGTADLSRTYVKEFATREVSVFEMPHISNPMYS
ncbi:MAG: phosphotransferase enzyme family protein [Chordicoccus sp.]